MIILCTFCGLGDSEEYELDFPHFRGGECALITKIAKQLSNIALEEEYDKRYRFQPMLVNTIQKAPILKN